MVTLVKNQWTCVRASHLLLFALTNRASCCGPIQPDPRAPRLSSRLSFVSWPELKSSCSQLDRGSDAKDKLGGWGEVQRSILKAGGPSGADRQQRGAVSVVLY